jgi:hypothetical protein
VQLLTETRFNSMQRLCSHFVLLHAQAKLVQDFWPAATCGVFKYDMSRSQSVMRIATTASPVPGMELRARVLEILLATQRLKAVTLIQRHWKKHKAVGMLPVTKPARRAHLRAEFARKASPAEKLFAANGTSTDREQSASPILQHIFGHTTEPDLNA